ncbi:unnamed protein product [Rhizopus stolonifer]
MTLLTSCLASRKRKRSNQHVRFSSQPLVLNTWSETDYDRSGLFFDMPMIQQRREEIIFALSINFVQKKETKSKRPKLSIDTSSFHGPLYFTSMTTHHKDLKEEEDFSMETRENTKRNRLSL